MKFSNKYVLIVIMVFLFSSSLFAFETGSASWYGGKFQGRKTASGEIFDTHKFTAAHKTLPFNTIVKVVNLKNNLSVEVRINDRGPFVAGRIIDLSMAAANAIDMTADGVAKVQLQIIKLPEGVNISGIKKSIDVHPEGIPESYRIQIASFSKQNNAEACLIKLKNAGVVAEKETSKTGMIRVIVNNLQKNELPEIINKIKGAGFSSPLVRNN